MALTPDGTILVAGSDAGDVKICRVAGKETLKSIKAHAGTVAICQVSPDGKRFVTVGTDNVIKLWDLASAKELRSWTIRGAANDQSSFVISVAFSPDGDNL